MTKWKWWCNWMTLVLLFAVAGRAHAYTTTTCVEHWFVPAPDHAFTGTKASWKKVKDGACAKHDIKPLRIASQSHDDYNEQGSGANESSLFAMLDGNGYYIHTLAVRQGPYCAGGDVPGFDPECVLPAWLRHYKVFITREYYQVTIGKELRQPATCSGAYATDGDDIFYMTHDHSHAESYTPDTPFRIVGAEPDSFQCFHPQDSPYLNIWARDAEHVFFDGRMARGMSPQYPITSFTGKLLTVGDLAINGDKVFSVDFSDGVELLPDIDANVRILSKRFFRDSKNIYGSNFKKIAGLTPESFSVLTPACPVPGNPGLHCETPGENDIGSIGIQNDLLVIPGDSIASGILVPIQGVNVENIQVFLLDGASSVSPDASPFMLFGGRLYSIRNLAGRNDAALRERLFSLGLSQTQIQQQLKAAAADSTRMNSGLPIHGQLRSIPHDSACTIDGEHGAGLYHYILDDEGGIALRSLARVGPCVQ